MNLFITKPPTNGYSTIADGDEETDSTSVPRTVRSWSGVVASVALLLIVAGGGAVWMLPEEGSSYTTATGGLVVATEASIGLCPPATGAFGGVSKLGYWAGERDPFETCYYQLGSDAIFCWTKAWQYLFDDDDVRNPDTNGDYYNCIPNDGPGSTWKYIDAKDINPVDNPNTNWCGPPCQGQHSEF